MRAKIGRLQKRWLNRKGGSQVTAQLRGKIEWSKPMLRDNALSQSCQTCRFQIVQYLLAQYGSRTLPIDAMCKVGHRDKHIQTFSPWWGQSRISARWCMEIERQILRHPLPIKDLLDMLAVLLRHKNGMVTQLRKLPVETQIE